MKEPLCIKAVFWTLLLTTFLFSIHINYLKGHNECKPQGSEFFSRLQSHFNSQAVEQRMEAVHSELSSLPAEAQQLQTQQLEGCYLSQGWQQSFDQKSSHLIFLLDSASPGDSHTLEQVKAEGLQFAACTEQALADGILALSLKEEYLTELTASIEAERQRLSEEQGKADSSMQQAALKVRALQDELKELKARIKGNEVQLLHFEKEGRDEEGEELAIELKSLEQSRADLAKAQRRLQSAMTSNSAVKSQISEKETEAAHLRVQIRVVGEQLASTVLKYGGSKQFLQARQNMLKNIEQRLQKLKSQLAAQSDSELRTMLKARIKALEDDEANLRQVLSSEYVKQASAHSASQAQLRARLRLVEEETSSLRSKLVDIQSLSTAVSSLRSRVEESMQRVSLLRIATAKAQSSRQQLDSMRLRLEQENDVAVSRLAELQAELAKAQRRTAKTNHQGRESNSLWIKQALRWKSRAEEQLLALAERLANDRAEECQKKNILLQGLHAKYSAEQEERLDQVRRVELSLISSAQQMRQKCPPLL